MEPIDILNNLTGRIVQAVKAGKLESIRVGGEQCYTAGGFSLCFRASGAVEVMHAGRNIELKGLKLPHISDSRSRISEALRLREEEEKAAAYQSLLRLMRDETEPRFTAAGEEGREGAIRVRDSLETPEWSELRFPDTEAGRNACRLLCDLLNKAMPVSA